MKTLNKIKYLIIIFLTVFVMNSFAQSYGPGDPGGGPEGGGDPIGGGAPNNGGAIVLATFAIAYGAIKVYQFTRLKHEGIE
jgi:hypothetical protein